MKRISGSTFVYLVISGLLCLSAFAETKITCKQGNMERVLEVTTGGEGGHACDVKYTKNGTVANESLYFATSDAKWCATKAEEQSKKWSEQGFQCDNAGAAGADETKSEEKTESGEAKTEKK